MREKLVGPKGQRLEYSPRRKRMTLHLVWLASVRYVSM